MRLSFNEIRARAASFAKSYADATYEKGETQTFYNDFFAIFGVERRSVARYEEHVKKLNNRTGFIDLFWPRVLLVEQKSTGRDLVKAAEQAGARRNHHLLEHQASRPCRRQPPTRRSGLLTRPHGAHLAPRMGTHPAHRRVQVAETPLKPL